MKRFLYLTDYYYPSPTSIGVCDDAVINELISDGNQVDVVCFGARTCKTPIEIATGLRVFHVKDRMWEILQEKNQKAFKRIGGVLCRMNQLSMMHFFPMSSITVPLRYFILCDYLYKNYEYDELVSTYAPFEACWAAYKLCKKNEKIGWSLYILDTFTNRGASKFFSEEWNDKHGWRWEKIFFSKASKIINLRCHEKHHQQERYDIFRNKMYFTDIPLFNPHKFDNIDAINHDEELCFVYTGRIDSHWYSPVKLCELFSYISKGKDWRLHFFGNPSDCEKYLDEMYDRTNGKIVKEGFVSRETVIREMKSADVLVSFGHMDSDMVQSKIFDYMSTGAKILHLTNFSFRDSAREYYKKYENAFVLDEKNISDKETMKNLVFFLENGQKLSTEKLTSLFVENRPETTVKILEY